MQGQIKEETKQSLSVVFLQKTQYPKFLFQTIVVELNSV